MAIKIKDIPPLDRPKERLKKYGAENLSDSELLAILINTGNKNNSAKDLASIILKKFDGVKGLRNVNYESLTTIEGIKFSKSCIILACVELAKRMNMKINDLDNVMLTSSTKVFQYYNEILKDENQECFYCVYLDTNKRVICDKKLFIGTLDRSIVHPRDVFKKAYLCNAHAIICVHNHPSGNITPSSQDIDITSCLMEVSSIHGIQFLDHIIIGKDKYFSFLENDLISL